MQSFRYLPKVSEDSQRPSEGHLAILPLVTTRANVRKLRSYVRSVSSGKQHAGNSSIAKWYRMHSQHIPLREHGS